MNTTQDHLLISDISDDIVLLKNGGGAMILQVSAVNFGLLSSREQIAIISSFAQMLNSLSFSIQIMIHSERLNITSYLKLLDAAEKTQTNPLLSKMIVTYRQFIQDTIKENEVLDKKFYLVVPLFSLELGITASKESLKQKIKTILLPRRDQVIRQLNRVGLKATQLNNQKLIELFYDIYNGQSVEELPLIKTPIEVNLSEPTHPASGGQKITAEPTVIIAAEQPTPQVNQPSSPPANQLTSQPASPAQRGESSRNHPFVVQELTD